MGEKTSARMHVPFYCPCCGNNVVADLLFDAIFADPHEPVIRCPCCEVSFRVELFELEDKK